MWSVGLGARSVASGKWHTEHILGLALRGEMFAVSDTLWTSLLLHFVCAKDDGIAAASSAEVGATEPQLRRREHPPHEYKYKLNDMKVREDLALMAEERGFKIGIELGVQRGLFSVSILSRWTSCTSYTLVDSWQQTPGYSDTANVNDAEQQGIYENARSRLTTWANKTTFMRNYTNDAALLVPDNRCVYFSHAIVNIVAHPARTHPCDSLDFIYVDARHDYCGVKEDLINWWPKLKKHGIMCGHDYMTGFQQLKARGSYR